MQISDDEILATQAQEVVETWQEEPQEDGDAVAHCNDSSAPVPQCHDASSPDLPLYANGGGGTAGNSGNC